MDTLEISGKGGENVFQTVQNHMLFIGRVNIQVGAIRTDPSYIDYINKIRILSVFHWNRTGIFLMIVLCFLFPLC